MPETSSLLLAAFPPELAGLDVNPPEGWNVACTGIGSYAAAITATRLIAEFKPSRVLFLGTCGAYDDRLSIGDLISASEAIVISLDELEGRSYRPSMERTRWPATWPLPFPSQSVAVPPAITKTLEGARRLAAIAATEHLELAGIFAACQEAGIPVGAVLAVANRVGPPAHEEWKTHHAEVSTKLVATIRAAGVL